MLMWHQPSTRGGGCPTGESVNVCAEEGAAEAQQRRREPLPLVPGWNVKTPAEFHCQSEAFVLQLGLQEQCLTRVKN
jgi:hypothetical protein